MILKVKQLDNMPSFAVAPKAGDGADTATPTAAEPPLLDHIGWRLWCASQRWQTEFNRAMVAAGYGWFGEARAALIPHIARTGTGQTELSQRLGLSKQAVQQLIDGLVADGIVRRRAHATDARARQVCFTRQGLAVLARANAVKQRLEDGYRQRLGTEAFDAFGRALDALAGPPTP